MRSGWKRVALDDVAEFRNGLNFNRGEEGHSVKVVGVGDFQRYEMLSDFGGTSVVTVTNQLAENDLLKDDDLLFVRSNGNKALVGRCVLISGITEPVTFSGFTIRARVKSKNVDHSYLSKLVRSPLFLAHLHKYGGRGSSINNLSQDALSEFTFGLPPLPEQRKIAGILRTWDRAIETVEALTANARAQKQALMQQLLPQGTTPPRKRLPGFSGEWREIRLGNAFTERVERGEGGLALLSVTQASGVVPQEEAGRRNISSNDQSNYKTVRSGDIAYNTMRMWQGASALSNLTGKVSPAYTVVTPRKGHDAAFYAYFFKQSKAIHVFERHSQGLVSDTWSLKFPFFAEIRICVPKFDEQKAIASAFKSADDLMFSYKTQLAALRREKAALMQQLLTGKRRVAVAENADA